MTLPRPVRALPVLLLLAGLAPAAQAAPAACPYKPEDLAKVFGVGFEAGKEEPGIGGTSCMYRTRGGSIAKGTEFTLWVLVIRPGSNQAMIRTMTAGGPTARFDPISGDPDGAARVRGAANDGLVDISYRRADHVVFLRASGQGSENSEAMAARLLKLPRLP